ncbi:MAG: hypothetical protein FD146_1975 [Anaerolineaceae bacterium]|nr:MAG: hypothetical protein FD146_1975 [Anaerolineaceae bacterium]
MLKDVNFRKDILAGIISSLIFLILFQPLVRGLGQLLQPLGEKFFTGFSNSLYSNAALGHRNYLEVVAFETGVSTFFGLSFGFFTGYLSRNRFLKIKEKNKQHITIVLKIGMAICWLMLTFGIIASSMLFFSDLQMNTSFEQRLAVVVPYLSEQEEEELRAKWASMQTRDDYEKINLILQEYAETYQIELPTLMWK